MRDFLTDIPDRSIAISAFLLAAVALVIVIGFTFVGDPTEVIGSSETSEPQVFKGEKGAKGDTGGIGPIGSIGNIGGVGPIGPKGDSGDTVGIPGPQGGIGPIGLRGLTGETGSIGNTGPRGASGLPGFVYPTPLSLSSPTYNYPLVVNDTDGFTMLSVSALGQEFGGGTIRPRVDLTNRQAFRLQFTHIGNTDVIKVGMQFLASDLSWVWLIPAFGEAVGENVPQSTDFYAIPLFEDKDFTIRIIVYGDNETDVRFSYLAIDAR